MPPVSSKALQIACESPELLASVLSAAERRRL